MQKEGVLTGFVAFVFGAVLFVCSFTAVVVSSNPVVFFIGLVSLFAIGTFLAFNAWLDNRLAEHARKRFLSKFGQQNKREGGKQ